ncbi:hypothetical protein [Streptomyces sp. NPDC057696]|uniref:hypothetical protein n=1 Tax=Streptomyces sp. NPDC057696 TaxID=3346218 RepID=UPI0036C56F91
MSVFINSPQLADARADPQSIDASKLGAQTPVTTGQIGVIAGLPVVVTNRITAGKFLLLKNNSVTPPSRPSVPVVVATPQRLAAFSGSGSTRTQRVPE